MINIQINQSFLAQMHQRETLHCDLTSLFVSHSNPFDLVVIKRMINFDLISELL